MMTPDESAKTESKQPHSAIESAIERIRAALPAGFVEALGDDTWGRLLECYQQPWRHYHDLAHIAEVLEVAARFGVMNTWEFTLAVLYHDAVYDPTRSDNEQRSAELLLVELSKAEALQHVDTDRVVELVMATAHHASERSFDADAQALLDCDCAILGAPRARYAEYMRGVRAEYGHVPEHLFEAGRRAFLQQLARRERLYHRADFEAAFGAQARSNLDWELSSRGVYKSDTGR